MDNEKILKLLPEICEIPHVFDILLQSVIHKCYLQFINVDISMNDFQIYLMMKEVEFPKTDVTHFEIAIQGISCNE